MENPHPDLQKRITKLIGERPTAFTRVQGGYTPAARWRVSTAAGKIFVKVATTPLTASMLRREYHAYQCINGAFIPELIGWEDDEDEPILVTEDLSDATWPPPWDMEQVEGVLEQLEVMHGMTAPLPPFEALHGHWNSNWQKLADDPKPFLSLNMASDAWLQKALPVLIEAENRCETSGQTLAHCDIRSDNICVTAQGVKLIDWAEACLANPSIDLGFWLPSLAFEGGPLPETILPDAPEVAAHVAGFFAARAGLAQIPDAPRVRLVQRQQLETALPWAARALDLPPLDPVDQ
ncbi:MAG: phosphotransferase [Anaerolineae bacterium]|nr:phosphotransferase [Anaerolineae bacterium]